MHSRKESKTMSYHIKQRLAGLAMAAMALAPIPGHGAGQSAEVVYEGAPSAATARVEGKLMASAATPAPQTPDNVPLVAAVSDESTSAGERIDMVFAKPDKDIMTQQALEKLNVLIESLEFSNADLQNVIRIIGERLNINFIFDAGDISGKVTLRLHNVRLRDALESILSSRKLAIVADRSGIFRIVPREQVGGKTVETKTEVIQLKWLSALDLEKTLRSFITPEIGKMEVNEESNTVIVTDVPPQLEIVKNLVEQIDIAERQVVIEARLADVNIGALRELGTKWSATKLNEDAITHNITRSHEKSSIMGPDGSTQPTLINRVTDDIMLGGSRVGTRETVKDMLHPEIPGFTAIDNPIPVTAGGLAPVLLEGLDVSKGKGTLSLGDKIGVFGNTYDFNAVFTALENRNIVEILANPRVTTLNNVPAKINIVERIPYVQASGMSSGGTSVPTIAFEDAGVDIQVKPIITPNGYVRMEIILKQMIFRKRVGTGELDPPQIDIRSATTNVIVQDTNTVVLGGLRQQRRLEQSNGVPWLSQIPLFGWLFKDKQYDQSKMELVLMMTPRIVTDELALNDREKYFYDKIDNDWHLPDYFFDDVRNTLEEKETEAVTAPKNEKGATDAKPGAPDVQPLGADGKPLPDVKAAAPEIKAEKSGAEKGEKTKS